MLNRGTLSYLQRSKCAQFFGALIGDLSIRQRVVLFGRVAGWQLLTLRG